MQPTSHQGRTYHTPCGSYIPRCRTRPAAPMLPIRRCHRSLRLNNAYPGEAPDGRSQEADQQASLHVAPPGHPATPSRPDGGAMQPSCSSTSRSSPPGPLRRLQPSATTAGLWRRWRHRCWNCTSQEREHTSPLHALTRRRAPACGAVA